MNEESIINEWYGTNMWKYIIGPTSVYRDNYKICGRLDIIDLYRDKYDHIWYAVLEWKDPDGNVHREDISRGELFKRSNTKLLEKLASGGLVIANAPLTLEYLQQCDYRMMGNHGT
jgi:hypothetical protein